MKVIFLDIDGELTYDGSGTSETASIDPEKVKLLRQIVDRTGAVIVLSSSWKVFYDRDTGEKESEYRILEEQLAVCGLSIFDLTPDIPAESDGDMPVSLDSLSHFRCKHGTGRAAEIEQWISENKPDSFVILDDEDHGWENYGLGRYWVRPCWFDKNGGLHQEHVDEAVRILNEL